MRSRERPTAPLLLSAAARPAAVATVVACLLVIAVQAVWIRHGMETGWLDTTADAKVQAALGGHPLLLAVLIWPGEPVPAIAMAAALVLACALLRRYRQAALAAVSVPAAVALTELALKPVIGRTSWGAPFPSGHVAAVAALVTVVTVLLARTAAGVAPVLGAALGFTALLVTAAAAVGVVGARFHHFSDTVGGTAVGVGTVLVTALVLDWLSTTHTRRPR